MKGVQEASMYSAVGKGEGSGDRQSQGNVEGVASLLTLRWQVSRSTTGQRHRIFPSVMYSNMYKHLKPKSSSNLNEGHNRTGLN